MKTIISDKTKLTAKILAACITASAALIKIYPKAPICLWATLSVFAALISAMLAASYYKDRKRSTRIKLRITALRKIQWMTKGWGEAFQNIVDAVKLVDAKAFENDAENVLSLANLLDKRGPGKDSYDVYCEPNLNVF